MVVVNTGSENEGRIETDELRQLSVKRGHYADEGEILGVMDDVYDEDDATVYRTEMCGGGVEFVLVQVHHSNQKDEWYFRSNINVHPEQLEGGVAGDILDMSNRIKYMAGGRDASGRREQLEDAVEDTDVE